MGDSNAQIGHRNSRTTDLTDNVGDYGRERTTPAGDQWIALLQETNLGLLNSFFDIPPDQRHTWENSQDYKSEIDHILFRKDHKHYYGVSARVMCNLLANCEQGFEKSL